MRVSIISKIETKKWIQKVAPVQAHVTFKVNQWLKNQGWYVNAAANFLHCFYGRIKIMIVNLFQVM